MSTYNDVSGGIFYDLNQIALFLLNKFIKALFSFIKALFSCIKKRYKGYVGTHKEMVDG